MESLYGQDLDSGHHGSGFPLPPSRKRLLEEHLRKAGAAANGKSDGHPGDCSCDCCKDPEEIRYNPEEAAYSEHCWNINNLPRCKVSTLPDPFLRCFPMAQLCSTDQTIRRDTPCNEHSPKPILQFQGYFNFQQILHWAPRRLSSSFSSGAKLVICATAGLSAAVCHWRRAHHWSDGPLALRRELYVGLLLAY